MEHKKTTGVNGKHAAHNPEGHNQYTGKQAHKETNGSTKQAHTGTTEHAGKKTEKHEESGRARKDSSTHNEW